MGIIEIKGMEFYAFHGHYEAERKIGNKFIIDLSIQVDLKKAAINDNLEDTINYQAVYELVKNEMNINSLLLENVAQRIIDKLYANFRTIENTKIKISKLNPPLGGQIKKVSITLIK